MTLEGVINRLATFDMSNFDKYTFDTIESTFKSQLVLSKRKRKHGKSDSDTFDDELDELEALIKKIFGRGGGKYKGKKSRYIAKEEIDTKFESNDDEVFYVAMK